MRKGLEIRIFIYCHLNSLLKRHAHLELGPAWAKEISHQTLDTELSDLARPIAGGLPAGLAEDEELVLGVTADVLQRSPTPARSPATGQTGSQSSSSAY